MDGWVGWVGESVPLDGFGRRRETLSVFLFDHFFGEAIYCGS